MSDELEPCPACESDDVETTYPDRGRCHVFCGDCGMRGPSVKTVEEADAAWNALPRRPEPPAPKRGVAAIIGRWPGDETDDEIERAAAELDGKPAVGPATREMGRKVKDALDCDGVLRVHFGSEFAKAFLAELGADA